MPTATLMNQKVREIHFNNDLERKHGTNRQLGSSFSFQVNYSPDGERCVAKLYHSLKDKEDEKLFFSISATTRAPRPGEKDGVQYYFLTKEDFEAKIAANAFLEHAKYVDNYYGTLEAPVNEKLEAGYDVILEIEVQGAMQVHEKRPDAVMVFIAPPSFEELANRLRGRGTEDEAKVQKRLETAKGELAQQDKFDYVVVNDTVERAVEELHGILAKRR